MFFRSDIKKAIEAAATLIRLAPHRLIGRKRLLALLYIADRECLKRAGRPIIGGRLVALKCGPIQSEVYNLIKGSHRDQTQWSKYFANDSHLVMLREDPGVSALSRFEIGILNEISGKFLGFDDWDVAEATHEFREFKDTYREGTATPIPPELLIDAVGLGKKKTVILFDAKEKDYFDRLFADNPKPRPQAPRLSRKPKPLSSKK